MRFRHFSALKNKNLSSKLENEKIILSAWDSNLVSRSLKGGHNGIEISLYGRLICYI